MQWVKPKGERGLPEATWQPKDLLPRLKRLPAKRMLAVPNVTSDSLDFRLFFDGSAAALPPGFSSPELAAYTVSGGRSSSPGGLCHCDSLQVCMGTLVRCRSAW